MDGSFMDDAFKGLCWAFGILVGLVVILLGVVVLLLIMLSRA